MWRKSLTLHGAVLFFKVEWPNETLDCVRIHELGASVSCRGLKKRKKKPIRPCNVDGVKGEYEYGCKWSHLTEDESFIFSREQHFLLLCCHPLFTKRASALFAWRNCLVYIFTCSCSVYGAGVMMACQTFSFAFGKINLWQWRREISSFCEI